MNTSEPMKIMNKPTDGSFLIGASKKGEIDKESEWNLLEEVSQSHERSQLV